MKKILIILPILVAIFFPRSTFAATTFLEPGGDATFNVTATSSGGLWSTVTNTPTVVTDIVHGRHIKSIESHSTGGFGVTPAGVVSDAGGRISFYFYIKTLPNATASIARILESNAATAVVSLRITSGGVLQIWNATTAQIGTNGATLSAGQWYRISLAYTITSVSVNRFEIFVDGGSSISVTNATLSNDPSSSFSFGNTSGNATADYRYSDFYVDNSSSLTDPGNIWVVAKRPFANGTTNGFTTRVGAGGSGYGSGHAPQVNERPISATNGWSMVGAGAAVTEEYNVEGKSVGDINIADGKVVDWEAWVNANSLAGETASIITGGSSSNISLTSASTTFTKIAGSTSYPAGTGSDVGIVTTTALTTVTLNEAGVIVAYIPTPFNPYYFWDY
jgi:hypothetical protein